MLQSHPRPYCLLSSVLTIMWLTGRYEVFRTLELMLATVSNHSWIWNSPGGKATRIFILNYSPTVCLLYTTHLRHSGYLSVCICAMGTAFKWPFGLPLVWLTPLQNFFLLCRWPGGWLLTNKTQQSNGMPLWRSGYKRSVATYPCPPSHGAFVLGEVAFSVVGGSKHSSCDRKQSSTKGMAPRWVCEHGSRCSKLCTQMTFMIKPHKPPSITSRMFHCLELS